MDLSNVVAALIIISDKTTVNRQFPFLPPLFLIFPPLLFYLAEHVLQEINTGLSKRQLLPSNFTQQQHKRAGTSATGREYKIQAGSSKQLTYSGAGTNWWHCSSRRTSGSAAAARTGIWQGSDELELGVQHGDGAKEGEKTVAALNRSRMEEEYVNR